jgi:rRNA-processing protein FCF1
MTKEMKTDFVDSVIRAIPMKNTMTRGQLVAAAEKRHYDALPADVKAFKKKYPNAIQRDRTYFEKMNHEMFLIVHRSNNRDPDLYMGSSSGYVNVSYEHDAIEGVTIEVADLVAQHMAHLDERLARHELRREMLAKCEACTTLAKLKDRFPDLIEHMPRETKTAVMVITPDKEIIKKLVKAGYPKKVPA